MMNSVNLPPSTTGVELLFEIFIRR